MDKQVNETFPVTIFYSYAHEDELLRNELEKHLSGLRRQGIISDWHDRQITAGTEWENAIDAHLNTASIILLLVSPDFLASDYCYSIEMQRALERHNVGEARVIPIILRPTDWQGTPFAKLSCLPRNKEPVTTWFNQDKAFLDVAKGIRYAIEYLRTPPTRKHKQLSRRTVILGLLGVGGLSLVGGGLIHFIPTFIYSSPRPIYAFSQEDIRTITWSPDGKYIASGSSDGSIQVWDVTSGNHVLTYSGRSYEVYSIAWSPDGKRIASRTSDGEVQIWEATSGNHILTYHNHSQSKVAWSFDNKLIILAGGSTSDTVEVWDTSTGKQVLTYSHPFPESVAFSPDRKHIASGSTDGSVQVWNLTTKSHIFTYSKHFDVIYDLAWSFNGRRIASGSEDKTVQIWDALTGDYQVVYREHTRGVTHVTWSLDDRYIISGSDDNTIRMWDVTTSKSILTYTDKFQFGLALSPNQEYIAFGTYDDQSNDVIQVWTTNAPKSTLLTYRRHSYYVESVAWSPDGLLLASAGSDRTVQVCDAFSGVPTLTYHASTNRVIAIAWSPDGLYLASCEDNDIHVWKVSNSDYVLVYRGHSDRVMGISWSANGKYIASCAFDGTVQVWGALTGERIHTYNSSPLFGFISAMRSVSWSPNSTYVAFGDENGRVQVWDTVSNTQIFAHQFSTSSIITSIAWSPDSIYIAISVNDPADEIQVWDIVKNKKIFTGENSSGAFVNAVAWSPDGTYIANASSDHTVQIWDIRREKSIFIYKGHTGPVTAVAWSPNGTRLASSGGGDTTVQVWVPL